MAVDATTSSAPTPADDAELMRRLELLVVRFLARRFRSLSDLWRLELDLLALQRDTQVAITRAKAHSRTPEGRRILEQLKGTLWHARRFGDTLAWVLFKGEQRSIYPLSYNQPVPVIPESHGSRGLVAAAQGLSQTLGFPLLHDLTDILRIGDVTFFNRDLEAQTVEIKSQLKGSRPKGRGTLLTYHVTALWPAVGTQPEMAWRDPPKPMQPAMASARFKRQLERMATANAFGTASPGTTMIGGRKTLIFEAGQADGTSHWPLVRRLIRRARRTGYASGVADSAMLYVVLYDKNGIGSPPEVLRSLPGDLAASGIFLEDTSRNSLWISSLPDSRGRGARRYLPYYLYPLPRAWILDILHGRLMIMSMLNVGRVAMALEEEGLRTADARGKAYLRVFCDFDVDGSP